MTRSISEADIDMPDPGIDRALEQIHARIEQAARRAGRDPHSVTLVAVSKTHPAAAVEAALAAGQRAFGENRVQEAEGKFPPLRSGHPDLRLHLIGPLQTNKAIDAVRLMDVIETLDRPRLADALEQAAQKAGRLPTLLIQVNIGSEPQKAGVMPDQADRFIDECRRRFGASLTGLMAIPPVDADPAAYFRRLAALGAAHGLAGLSMGMSGDFEQAIACGATSVRVGTAIFGGRPSILPDVPPPGPTLAAPLASTRN